MRGLICLFCNKPEKNYMPVAGNDFICGSCVQLLSDAEQDDLKRAHSKAIKKGYLNKASAIESFIIPEEKDGKRPKTKKRGRYSHRKRINRTLGNQKERIKRVAV